MKSVNPASSLWGAVFPRENVFPRWFSLTCFFPALLMWPAWWAGGVEEVFVFCGIGKPPKKDCVTCANSCVRVACVLRACYVCVTCVRRGRTYVTIKIEMECGTSLPCKALESHVSATVNDHAVLCVLYQYSSDVIAPLVKLWCSGSDIGCLALVSYRNETSQITVDDTEQEEHCREIIRIK